VDVLSSTAVLRGHAVSASPTSDGDVSQDHTILTITRSGSAPRVVQERREHFLTVIQGSQAGRYLQFGAEPVTLGRKSMCEFMLPDAEVSGRHCQVSALAHQTDALVTDLQSTNGTFVEGKRVQGSARLPQGGLMQIGDQVLKHEYRLPSELRESQELDRDLDKANRYVQSLLPAPLRSGPVRADWFFQPSARLGGDAFGYHRLDEQTFALYLVDVSGHGASAAMHSVSVMNVLRQRALPGTDFHDPAQVLRSLNAMFQMESHGGMYFSMWYGTYQLASRELHYASAGHHPSYLTHGPRGAMQPLQTRNLVIGALPEAEFVPARVDVAPDSTLYVFSDGVFEIVTKEGTQWGLQDFLPLLTQAPPSDGSEPERLYRAVLDAARPGALDDDFSMLIVTFV
jgi:serine phosphatase RsbU (regulator of sigma subunit)